MPSINVTTSGDCYIEGTKNCDKGHIDITTDCENEIQKNTETVTSHFENIANQTSQRPTQVEVFTSDSTAEKPQDIIHIESSESSDSEGIAQSDKSEGSISDFVLHLYPHKPPQCWVCKDKLGGEIISACSCVGVGVHKLCLISWMNELCKGRCPTCAYKYRVKTLQKPFSKWKLDPMLVESRKKYIIMVSLNIGVALVCAIVIIQLMLQINEKKKEKIIIATVISVIFVLYMFYQSRLYWLVYERMKIYNDKVVDILEKDDTDEEGTVRGNLSSFMNASEVLR